MPVELTITETSVVLESATAPGPPGPPGDTGEGVPAGGTTGQSLVKASNADFDTDWATPASTPVAGDVAFTPAGGIAATDVQSALEELDTEKAASSHVHDGAAITTGTVAEARIDAAIARDTEVTNAVAAEATARDSAISTAIANLVASAPGVLDTLDEIAAALGDDPNFATTMTTALAGKQPLDSDLTAIAALTTTAFGRALLELANAAALRTAAGLVIGTDVEAHDPDLTTIGGLSPTNDDLLQRKAGAWTNRTIAQLLVDLAAPGTTFQPLDSDLTALAGLAIAADKLPYGNGSHTMALADFTSFARSLVDDADAATARATLGVIASLFQSGGAQAIKLDDLAAPDDNTDLNASTSAHGLLKKLPNDATKFLDGTGAFSTPSAEDVIAGIFGTPDTAFEFNTSSLTGLTTIGSPDTEDANTSVPGHYFISDNDNVGVGTYVAATPPFTVITKLSDRTLVNVDGCKAGLFVGDSSPSLGSDCNGILHGNSNGNVWAEVIATSNITNTFGGTPPIYFAIRVNSTTDVDFLFSKDGRVWFKIVDSRNPSITIATCGLYIYTAGSNLQSAAFDFLRIWNSAKTFPGAAA